MPDRTGNAPDAIGGYDHMPGYRYAGDLLRELLVTARRLAPGESGLDTILAEKATAAFLSTAEAGARASPHRRFRLYRKAMGEIVDCEALVAAAEEVLDLRPELFMGTRVLIQETEQLVLLAAAAMRSREIR